MIVQDDGRLKRMFSYGLFNFTGKSVIKITNNVVMDIEKKDIRKNVIRRIIQIIITMILTAVILFVSAGRIDWIWAFLPAILIIILFIIRTSFEDSTLKAKLPGYKEFAGRVRYRLLPFIW